jgi:hypothetical protein
LNLEANGYMAAMDHSCLCTHDRGAHTHFRLGSDCAACPPDTCHRFRNGTPLRLRLVALLRGANHSAVEGRDLPERIDTFQSA